LFQSPGPRAHVHVAEEVRHLFEVVLGRQMRSDRRYETSHGERAVAEERLQVVPVGFQVAPRQQLTLRPLRGHHAQNHFHVLRFNLRAVQRRQQVPSAKRNGRLDLLCTVLRFEFRGCNRRHHSDIM